MSDNSDHGHDNTEYSSHRPGAVRRALAKVKNTTGHSHDTRASYVDDRDDDKPDPHPHPHPHPKVKNLVDTVGYSLVREIMQYMKGPDGEEAMEVIFTSQSRVAARLAVSDDAKRAARIAAEEATTGTYDGFHHKFQELVAGLPTPLLTVGSVLIGSYVVLLSVGVLFSLWRFALFGLQ